jgi:phage baseplate assembly protein W
LSASNSEFLGTGLITPFRRLGSADFMSTSGPELVRSSIRQIVGIQMGEIKWRPKFGQRTGKLKNKPNTEAVEHMLSDDLQSGIKRHEPRATTVNVTVNRRDNKLLATIQWSLSTQNTTNNQTLVGPDSFDTVI